MLDEFFTTSNNLKMSSEQEIRSNKNIQFVKGSDLYKSYYEQPDKHNINNTNVRYYQIAIFDEFDKHIVRSFLFKGTTSKGACFYDYKIIELKDYKLSKNKLDKFVKILNKQKQNNTTDFKIMYKHYPVYNFDYTNPPTGNDISECMSELLN